MYKLILLETLIHLKPFGLIFGVDLEPHYEGRDPQNLTLDGSVKVAVMNELIARQKLIKSAQILALNPNIERLLIVDRHVQDCRHPKIFAITNVSDLISAMDIDVTEQQRRKLRELLFVASQNPIVQFLTAFDVGGEALNITVRRTTTKRENYRKRLKLAEENEEEEEVDEKDCCCVCLTRRKTIMLAPCQHQVLCDQCADRIMEDNKKCPLCRVVVTDLFRPLKV